MVWVADWSWFVLLPCPGAIDLLAILQRAVCAAGTIAFGGSGCMQRGALFRPRVRGGDASGAADRAKPGQSSTERTLKRRQAVVI